MKKSLLYLCLSTSIVMLTGCGAGKEPYDELPKADNQLTVSDIEQTPERQYLYIRSVGDAPRYAASILGLAQGDPKLVKLHTTKNGIQVTQIDRDNIGLTHDGRYDNEFNEAPVLTIGGEYVDYKCTEDRWGDCTNVEQENTDADLEWNEKRYFVPDFSKIKIAELDSNDIFTFGECVTEVGQPSLTDSWKGYEMDLKKGVINFEIKHTFQAASNCLNEFYNGSLDNLSFTTTEFISIVAIDQLASEDYKAIPYSSNDENTYGFFTSTHKYRDATDTEGVDGYVRTYLNRFNPAKTSLTYYMSNNFFEAKNKIFLDAANESVTALNIQNKIYKTGLPEVKLVQAQEKHHGDLRYNFLTLFDEPLDNGLAGYGPSAANPLTGEIVSGRVNQYSSNLKQGAVYYYRRIRLDYNRGKLDPKTASEYTGIDYTSLGYPGFTDATKTLAPIATPNTTETEYQKPVENLVVSESSQPSIPKSHDFESLYNFDQATRDFWAEHNMMSVDSVYAAGGVDRELPLGIKGHTIDWKQPQLWVDGEVGKQLIEFEKMPVAIQDDLTTKLAAQAFVGTLTHELGHNFGLRHNFAGSRDHENTFTEAELAEQKAAFAAAGYTHLTAKAEFSSQMDYNVDRFATAYGRYDLAALQFGYAREVEKAPALPDEVRESDFVSLKNEDEKRREELKAGIIDGPTRYGVLYNIEQSTDLRSYDYCTDGHVSLNSNCNRSDAGVSLEDIDQFYIDKYTDSYETSNLRHNRQDFFEDNTLNYTVRRYRLFNDIRQFIEDERTLGRVEAIYGLPENYLSDLCASDDTSWFCDYQKPMQKSADFFLKLVGESDLVAETTYRFIDSGSIALQHTYDVADELAQYPSVEDKMVNKLAPGETITHLSTSSKTTELLKELFLKLNINPAYQDQLTVEIKLKGRRLNGVKSTESSPNHPYINERDVLGVWPDKLLAVRSLVSRVTPRRTTGRSNKALVDLPEVGAIFKDMLCQMVMDNQSACNKSGRLNDYLVAKADFALQSIEPLPNYDHSISRFFGFETVNGSPKGKSNLLQMVLRQIVLASQDSDYLGEQKARVWREYVGIHYANQSLAASQTITINGRNYLATDENTLAAALIEQIQTQQAAKAHYAALVTADPTDSASAEQLEAISKKLDRDSLVLTYLPVLD